MKKTKKKVIIMGAAGRDFHNFNIYFKNNPHYKVVAFTAFQIPNIAGRKYKNIPIFSEEKLLDLIKKKDVQEVFFSYSDISYEELKKKSALVTSAGASFSLLDEKYTMYKSKKPVVAVTAVRTGCGKSFISQKIADYFSQKGIRVGIVRHPMPYGDLEKQVCQKFTCVDDLKKHHCTIEEIEEYEPYLEKGLSVYAGVDYEKILRVAEKDNDLILWDGGNNDTPFFKPDFYIVLADARRPGHEVDYYPGKVNFENADIILIGKIDKDSEKNVKIILDNAKRFNSGAKVIKMRSVLTADNPGLIKNKRVLVVEDGPSMTHGGLAYGIGFRVAQKYKARSIVDPRLYATGSIKDLFKQYKHLGKILPATGYGKKQTRELEEVINRVDCDSVILATPARLEKFLKINKPFVSARFSFTEIGKPCFEKTLDMII